MKKFRSTNIFVSLLLVFVLNQLSNAQLTSNQVDSLVNLALKKFNVAGASVAIVKDGKIIHEKGYGFKSVATKEKVNEFTQFEIASNSKAFTSAALAILVEEGKLKWTDKVVTHIPEFKMYNDYVTANFTILDLLTHRSGLGLGIGDLMIPQAIQVFSKLLISLVQNTPLFMKIFLYQNQPPTILHIKSYLITLMVMLIILI